MGVELVEGQDLFVQNDAVYMRTTRGPRRVHVVYRGRRRFSRSARVPAGLGLGVPACSRLTGQAR